MKIESSIHIDAPLEVVWAVTEDIERWPEWTPTVESVERVGQRPFGLGSEVLIKQPAQPESVWSVIDYVPRERFSWETRRTGLRMIGTHELTRAGSGTTNRLQLEVSGFVGILLWSILYPATRWALAQENQALKRRCETKVSRKAVSK